MKTTALCSYISFLLQPDKDYTVILKAVKCQGYTAHRWSTKEHVFRYISFVRINKTKVVKMKMKDDKAVTT